MIHRFTILIPEVSDELFDRIAGQCPDSLSGVNEDRAYVDFSRESDSLARFLQHEFVTIVTSTGYGDAVAVWHQAPDSSSITDSCG